MGGEILGSEGKGKKLMLSYEPHLFPDKSKTVIRSPLQVCKVYSSSMNTPLHIKHLTIF
ncbi:hypothetical protein NARC_70114 [Candidatus Nitrosocosmicus arcticus]|uniref:Uncharacterized protein n=1 Tax=Candidatus Nitrosocosmicus arcticus TaxID=2035267 RepID=A0A557SVB7_9ARCH|nr:hypothetical protein NARC_70114 [Candidatus Nitrosocosmicus arcticus]